MAYGDSFTPRGASADIKLRGPVWVGIFSFVTLGIYAIYWIYVTAKHLRDFGNARGRDLGQKPGMTLLALTLGWLLLFIPPIVALVRQGKRIQQAQQLAGVQPMNGWLALVLYLVVSPVFFAYEQSELNKAWAAEGAPLPSGDGDAPRLPAAEQPLATSSSDVGATRVDRPGA
jgi:uncharacterized membrane protein YhaH (DUF805 family)